MSRLLKFSCLPVLAIGLSLITGGAEADAGGFSITIGNYGHRGYGGYRSLRPSIGHPAFGGRSFRPSYNYSKAFGHPRFRSGYHHPRRPHYDYHPPSLIPHRNHYDFVPGHWDYHHRGHRGHRRH